MANSNSYFSESKDGYLKKLYFFTLKKMQKYLNCLTALKHFTRRNPEFVNINS